MIVLFIAYLFLFFSTITITFAGDKGLELLKAAEHGDTDKLIELLNTGVPLYTRNNFGVSPIVFAANNGHTKTLEAMLDRGAYIEDRSNNGRTPLAWASRWGHLETVKLLLDRGANITAIDVDGMTPLMHAVTNDHVHIVKELIDRGAPITIKNFHDGTALSIAKHKGNQEIVKLIEHHFSNDEEVSIYYLLAQHLYEYSQKMVKKGINRAKYHLGITSKYVETEL